MGSCMDGPKVHVALHSSFLRVCANHPVVHLTFVYFGGPVFAPLRIKTGDGRLVL